MSHEKIIADFKTTFIKKGEQFLVMIKDNTDLRKKEKAIISN